MRPPPPPTSPPTLQADALGELQAGGEPATAFVCGPPAMADGAAEKLAGLGLPPERIRLERWW